MNLAETLRGLLRRWYITFPGLILAVAATFGAWTAISPSYARSATELLIPGKQNMPAGSNPLLFLGGLSYAADVLVTAVGAESVAGQIQAENPGTTIEVQRSGSSSGPLIEITVTAPTDAATGRILDELVAKTSTVLEDLQVNQKIATDNRITVVPVAVDTTSTLQQRSRLVTTAVAGLGVAAITLLLAGLVDGLSSQRRRRPKKAEDDADQTDDQVEDDEDAAVVTTTDSIHARGAGETVAAEASDDSFAPAEEEESELVGDLAMGSQPARREQ